MEITTVEQIQDILNEVRMEAHVAAEKFFNEKMNGEDRGACGFAWVGIYKHNGQTIKGNTKLGRLFKKVGVSQNHRRIFEIWNPSGYPVQNIDTLEAGANAAAQVLQKYGFTAYAGSRLD